MSGLTSAVTAISAGGAHASCALTASGGVVCWGYNFFGELGNGSFRNSRVPVQVQGLESGVAAISVGGFHACALTIDGAVMCWGGNDAGQLGNGSTDSSNVPVAVPGLTSGVKAISAGDSTTCALTTDGAVLCWGARLDRHTHAPSETASLPPTAVPSLGSGVASISVGFSHACAVTVAGAALCWGDNFIGELGDGSRIGSPDMPRGVHDLTSGVAAISAGTDTTCALTTAGAVLCWGDNGFGAAGHAGAQVYVLPLPVQGLSSGVAAVWASHYETSCALTTAGRVVCWGGNNFGQLGDGSHERFHILPIGVEED